MKKIVKIVAIMAVLSTVFVGCKKPDDPVDTPTSEPAGTGTTTPTTPDGNGEDTNTGISIVEKVEGAEYADGVIKATAGGDWGTQATVVITLKEATDFSKGIKITGKAIDWVVSTNGMKVIAVENETNKNEQNFQLPEEAGPVEVKDFRVCWSSDDSLKLADMTKIIQLVIQTQLDKGKIEITNIEAM